MWRDDWNQSESFRRHYFACVSNLFLFSLPSLRPGRHGHVRIRYPHVLDDTPASSPLSLTQDLISNLRRRAVLTASSFDPLVSLVHRLSFFPCSLAPLFISSPLSTLPLRSTSLFIDLVALLPTTNIGTWSVVYMTYSIVPGWNWTKEIYISYHIILKANAPRENV